MMTLKLRYGVISTDEHVQEAADVWTSRMSKTEFVDDIPQLRELPDGNRAWFIADAPPVGGRARQSVPSVAAAMEPRNAAPKLCRDAQPRERPFDRPDTAVRRGDRRVHDAMRVGVTFATVLGVAVGMVVMRGHLARSVLGAMILLDILRERVLQRPGFAIDGHEFQSLVPGS